MVFADYMDEFDHRILKMESVRDYEYKKREIVDNMKSTQNNTSKGGHKKKVALFSQALKKETDHHGRVKDQERAHHCFGRNTNSRQLLGAPKPGHK